MRRTGLLLASMATAVLLGCGLSFLSFEKSEVSAQTLQKPNFVFILADDMRKDDLRYMPKTRSFLADKGMRFQNAFVSTALCCPSRATTMRGQYAHNTGVWRNGGSEGGWRAYRHNLNENDNVATRLDDAGYRTALLGKYFNGYSGTTVPPGWDRWFATFHPPWEYFNYDVNDDGTLRHFGKRAGDYQTDVLRRKTEAFIGASGAQGDPFFAYVAPLAPHAPAIPAPRDRHAHDGLKAPRDPSFNEKDVSDKPPWIRGLPRLSAKDIAMIDQRQENRAESLQALDDLVAGVIDELKNARAMGNTYVFFTSDNGLHAGEHRIRGSKGRPYEEDVRVPLLVRGPGVRAGSTTQKLTLNTDYLPTFTELAGLEAPDYVDGRSLRPVLEGDAANWRSAILLEAHRMLEGTTPSYHGVRTSSGKKYLEYAGGKKELYNLERDPYELRNRSETLAPSNLASRLAALKGCARDSCRTAENRQ